ncbi:MAG: glycosyltransferase family 2 protein [Ginsengibacter sp.]
MLISGFSFVRNATKLYYPVKASIESILPIVHEFVIAVGKGDADDHTLEEIQKINSDKIKIIHTEWDLEKYPGGSEYAHQTDIAKNHCKGDWLFYLQSDEVIHEKYLPAIEKKCREFLNNKKVEGLLFDYKHFWGDYSHYIVSHKWYPKEIRIIRNKADIHSWRDAQSFRRIPGFDGINYFQKENTFKLKVAEVDAAVYHYGWVRPPGLMQKKRLSFETHMQGDEKASAIFEHEPGIFNYGDLEKLSLFSETHPGVMKDFINKFNWREQLYPYNKSRSKHKHDDLKYRLLTYVEQKFLGGRQIGGFKNYKLLKPKSFNQ